MPLSRLLLPLCGLLLALAVTAATAEAPLYGPGEMKIIVEYRGPGVAQFGEIAFCSLVGGSLVPIVTDAVYTLVRSALYGKVAMGSFSYMGGSTLLSSAACTTSSASLECIWYWDQGRYSGVQNAIAFYRGNRDTKDLYGAGMMTTTVRNHWRSNADGERCPCKKMQRYGALIYDNYEGPSWSDTEEFGYSYGASPALYNYSLCAIEQTVTTTTARPPTNSGANRPLVASFPVAVALTVMVIVAWL